LVLAAPGDQGAEQGGAASTSGTAEVCALFSPLIFSFIWLTSDPFASSVTIAPAHHLPRSAASAHAAARVHDPAVALSEGGARRPGPAAVSRLSAGANARVALRKQPHTVKSDG
jgi:hypothetical protein